MFKFLLLVAVAIWIYYMFRRNPAPPQEPPVRGRDMPEDMVRCAECGVHLPRSESIMSKGQFYCSDEHRRKHQG